MLNFILLAQQSWEEKNTGSNIWDMAQVLAKDHRVLLINPALDWSSLISPGKKKRLARSAYIKQHQGDHLIEVNNNLWLLNPRHLLVSINWLPDSPIYDRLNKYNGQLLAGDIQTAVDELKWTSYILINDNDMLRGYYLKTLLQPTLYIYYLRDNLLATTYWQRHGNRLEPLLMQQVDLIASNSIYLTQQAAKHNRNAVYVGQGCDLSLFNPDLPTTEPIDILNIPRPRIGYTGALTALRLDAQLLEAIALRQPGWQIILIGGIDESFPQKRLEAIANITFLPAKPMETIPAYLANMDVLINPQILNEVTIGNYPRKIDEYLAMGKPVIALKTDAMTLFSEQVYLAEGVDEFIACIDDALGSNPLSSPEERSAFALEHSWDNSVRVLTNAIDELLAQKSKLV